MTIQNTLNPVPSRGDDLSLPSSVYREIGRALVSAAHNVPGTLLPLKSTYSQAELRAIIPDGSICVCDFPVEGVEQWEKIDGGFRSPDGGILNIDHHADCREMSRIVSSGNLACQFVRLFGVPESHVVIHHTDCDSVISRLVMTGLLPPEQLFEDAVIAADHTGLEHPIADLLQALEIRRDFEFSVRNLGRFLAGEQLEPSAEKLLAERKQARLATAQAVRDLQPQVKGGVVAIPFDGVMRNEFLPALFPDAMVFVTSEPAGRSPADGVCERYVMRLRLGQSAPDEFSLHSLQITDFDRNYGGRWNAGANKRSGGTALSLEEYADAIRVKVQKVLGAGA